ncbi:hypothetical protein [Aurantibacillus circumpalustris]|uniref:hypothetical protein n=1 Tax=Aurantibacillus circumpalustris TaxID=3036359 RepID=UPI00295C0745|nr:hypothetical protein [Aurantibacillus circumpalustris]
MIKKITIILVVCLFFSCNKNSNQKNITNNPVPSVLVNYTTYPGDPLNSRIQSIGGWMYVDHIGINGIIIYRKSQEEFVAIERTSSYLPDNSAAKVQVLIDNFTLRDTVSNSQWRLFDGTVTQGPAEWPLRIYGTSFNGNALTIKN